MAKVLNGSLVRQGIDITFASGMTNRDFEEWMTVTNSKKVWFYEQDGASWDSTMRKEHYDCKWPLYDRADPELGAFMRKCANTKGVIYTPTGRINYQTSYTTKSGHNDTSLGNSIINISIALEAMLKLKLTGRILVMGDDLLVAIHQNFDADEFAAVSRSLGITPEYRKFDSWEDVSFISARWYPTGLKNQYLFAPRLSSIFDKLFWTVKHIPEKQKPGIVAGICMGVKALMPNMPMVSEFIRANENDATPILPQDYKYRHIFTDSTEASYITLGIHLQQLYHLLPSEIEHVKRLFASNKGKVGVICDEVLDKMRSIDKADIVDRVLFKS
jgi:hypothetical protein